MKLHLNAWKDRASLLLAVAQHQAGGVALAGLRTVFFCTQTATDN